MSSKTLHFSLGPVQGFVSQARRTKDFWTGSFLLSWLSGQALRTVLEAGGNIVFPNIEDDPLMKAITSDENPKHIPKVASLPNRFMATVPADFQPELCRQAILSAWQNTCLTVYNRYILPLESLGKGTKEIWDRQVNGFWEITWAIGPEASTLDRRKNWRSHVPTIEPGDKCSLMGNLQELSGYVRSISQESRREQDRFWDGIRGKAGYEIKPNERLCAVAFTKRMFPGIAEQVIDGTVPKSYPSTTHMACLHWLKRVTEEQNDLCNRFAMKASSLGVSSEIKIPFVQELNRQNPDLAVFCNLDPNCFFESSLKNDTLWAGENDDRALRTALTKLLGQFSTRPSPFYALLLMDGDKMGEILSENPDNVDKISAGLGEFSRAAAEIVAEHNGICIYAGGDDVMAMLSLEDALGASAALHAEYLKSFANIFAEHPSLKCIDKATISAAIIYAHQNTPLQLVVRNAHATLGAVAKDASGRNSLAIRVLNSSGPNLTWSAPWEVIKSEDPPAIERLAAEFSLDTSNFTSSFFYNLRRLFDMLSNPGDNQLDVSDMERILMAEYLRGRKIRREDESDASYVEGAEQNVKDLLAICRTSFRAEGKVEWGNELKLDGAMLVKFLATKGVEQ